MTLKPAMLPTHAEAWTWQLYGACRTRPKVDFFPDGQRGIQLAMRVELAKSICRECSVINTCRQQRTADSWGFTIDLDTNAISYTPPPDAARAAQKRRRDLLRQRILGVLTRAEGADDELAAAILGAAGLATPDGVPPT
jgi:hypothetical protein